MKLFSVTTLLAALSLGASAAAHERCGNRADVPVAAADNTRLPASASKYAVTNRPAEAERLFTSEAVEAEIARVKGVLTNARLAWMFENCFPNTLDTTVRWTREDEQGRDDTVIYTGDIHAMWLRDSGAQVWPYVQLAPKDEKLRRMIAGVIRRQFKYIGLDPYANAFLDPLDPDPDTHWQTDGTQMRPEVYERKWEIDSLCYPIRLAYEYWKRTGDTSVFDEHWLTAMENILRTFREQQRKEGVGPYTFLRVTDRQLDTVCNVGNGNPVNPVGLIASVFRPSDDATTFLFLVPSNFFAVTSLRKAAEILTAVNGERELAAECTALADEVAGALQQYAVVEHPEFGKIYAFEVDGFGGCFLMDDANVPSLLAMAYLGDVERTDPVYENTRCFVWSDDNPYFWRGAAGEGIGGPHIGVEMIWPMSIMMRAFTSEDDAEIREGVSIYLKNQGYTVHGAANGAQGLELARQLPIHLAVVDVMMPVMDGITMVMKLRDEGCEFPVIMLSAKSEDIDKITGLNIGADDYVTKPFSPIVLAARVRTLLKREGRAGAPLEQLGKLSVNELRREVMVENKPIDLTPKEYELLIYFKNNRAIALSRESILNAVWGYDYFGDLRTVDTHVKKLRAKLGECGTMIETVRGYGYRFEV